MWSVQLQCQGDIRSSTDNDIFVAFIDLLKSSHSEQTCEAMLLNISMVIEEYVSANIPMRKNKGIVHTGNADKDMGPCKMLEYQGSKY